MGHERAGAEAAGQRGAPGARLDADGAASVAATLQALATPSRLLILTRLRQGPCAVGELADAVGMEQSAVSHQLRLLRALGLVTGLRQGRTIVYSLYDSHVAMLLDEAVYHVEHLRLGLRDAAPAATAPDDGSTAAPSRGPDDQTRPGLGSGAVPGGA